MRWLIVLFLFLGVVDKSFAEEGKMIKHSYQYVAPGKCKMVFNGQAKLHESTNNAFPTSCQINGQLIAESIVFPSALEVNGQAKCTQCTFEDDVLFQGDTTLSHCVFHKAVEVTAGGLVLSHCKANKVYLTSPKWISFNPFSRPKIYLKDNTHVDYISFNSPGGKVICSKGSTVSEVKNGSVYHK